MGIDVLGALRIGGSAASLQRRDQVVLCALAMRPGDVLAADRLAEALWGDEPPRSWSKVVQGCVLRLRRALGVSSIETTAAGYRLTVPDDEIDCRRFEELITRGVSLASTDDFDRAIVAFGRALELWRGHPLEVLDGWSPGRIEAARLDELRRSAEERLLDARLEFGEHREVVGIAEARVAEEPLREHRWATLAVAQYRCGRQAEALRSLNRARQTLVEELGIGPGAEIVELEQSILNQDDALLVTPEPPAIADHCPYKGLAPYDVEDAEGFFGRSEEVAECLQRLRDSPLLVVTGPSGCGKSSLARAGLVPALVRAGHRVAVFVPGNDPQAAMEEVLASCDRSPVLVVDQFEEAFLLTGASGDPARSFCARLGAYATAVAPVIVTVRADHVAGLGVDLEFARLAERGLHIVTALSGEPLRQAIEGPATLAGLRIEPGLVDLLVRDCEGEPGALPLLSHALAETWQRRDGRVLTVEAYRATGEIRGAVARSADRLYESLPAEQRAKLRSLLLRLVSSTPDGQPVRSRIATRALSGDIERERVLALLVRARLVTAEEDSVELAHEALARAWPRLRSWLDEDAAGQRILRHLSAAADGWESLGRPESELYRGARLEAALEWRAASSPDLTDEESEFLDASVAAVESERRRVAERAGAHARQRRRQRAALAGVAVLLLAAVGGGLVAYNESRATARDQHAAEARALATTSAALRSTQPDLAALLAVEAYRIAPSAAAESSLFGTFTANPGLQRTVHTPLTLGGVPAAAFVPGTDTLAVANVHGGIHLIDLASGEHEMLGPTANEPGGRAALDVAANGRYVALLRFTFSDRSRSVLTVWDLGTGQQRFDPVRLPYRSSSVAISDDGALVAMGGVHAEPSQLRDGVTGELLWEIEAVPDAENEAALATASVEFAPDGRLVVGSRAGAIRFLDPGTRAELRRIDGPQGFSEQALLFDPEGRNLVTVGTDGFLAYDVNSGLPMSGQHLHPDCTSPALVPGRRALICLGTPGTVLAFDINSGAELDMPGRGYPDDVCALAVSADGARLVEVAACHDSATFVPWRLDGGGPASRLAYPTSAMHAVQGFGFAGDSSAIVAWQGQGEQSATLAIDPATGDVIDEFPDAYGLVPTEDPNVVVAVFGDTTVGTYDVVRHAVVERVDVGFANDMLDVQGDRVAVGGGSVDDFVPVVQVQVVDFAADPQLGALIDGTGEFEIVDFFLHAEHGLFLAISFDDSDRVQVERRDPMTGEVLGEPAAGYRDLVVGGGVVFLITAEGAMVEVDPTTLEPTGAPFGEVRLEDWVPVDPHGRRLAVVSDTPSLHFYDVASRTQLGDTIELGELALGWSGGAFSSDGKQFAVDTEQGIVVWDLDPDHWVRGACELAGRNLTGPEWDQYLGDAGSYRRTCPAFGEPDATADTEPLGTPAE